MAKKAHQAQQTEIPIEGPGVSAVKDKKLDTMGREFRDLRDQAATVASERGQKESAILDRMKELGIKSYRLDDQMLTVKPAKRHVALKTIKNEGVDDPWEEADAKVEAAEGDSET